MRNFIFLAAIFINAISLFSQSRLDSLRGVLLKNKKEDIEKVNSLNALSSELINARDVDAGNYAQQALALAKKLGYKKGMADSYLALGEIKQLPILKDPSFVNKYYDSAAALFLLTNKHMYGYCLLLKGRTNFIDGQIAAAFPLVLEGAEIMTDNQGPYTRLGYNHVGLLYLTIDNTDKAAYYFAKAARLNKLQNDYLNAAQCQMMLGIMYVQINLPDSAIAHSKEAIDLLLKNGFGTRFHLARSYESIAAAYLQKRNTDSATVYLDRLTRYSAATPSAASQFIALMQKLISGRIDFLEGRYSSAEIKLKEAESVLKTIAWNSGASLSFTSYPTVLNALFELYEKTGRRDLAYKYFMKFHSLNDSLQNAKKKLVVEDLESYIRIAKKERENQALQADLELERSRSYYQKLYIILSAIVSVLSFLIIYILNASRKKIRSQNVLLHERNIEIETQNEEITSQRDTIAIQTGTLQQKNQYLFEVNERLQELNQEKEGLLAMVVSDLKIPMNRTRGLLNLLNTDSLPKEERIDINRKAIKINDEGLRLIADLLEVSPPSQSDEDSRQEISSTSTRSLNLRNFLDEEVLQPLRAQAIEKQIELFSVVEPGVILQTDSNALKRIFQNLVSNSIKFSGPQTTVILQAEETHDLISISVHDQGPGISHEDQQKMFKKFQRLSARPTAGEPSRGLGLALVKVLVDKLGGEIFVDSTLGVGTEIAVSFKKQHL